MPYAMETLLNRLEKKNAAIAKRAATTKKHAQRYLKNLQKKTAKEMEWDFSFDDMLNSAKEIKYLIKEKKEILKLIEEAKKNLITLPEVLVKFQEELRKSFINDRIFRRDWLKGQWEETYLPMSEACTYEIFDKFVNGKYREMVSWSYNTRVYSLKKDAVIDDEDKADLEIFLDAQKADAWKNVNGDKMNENDESIAKRSAKDAKVLVEDLYKRTFGFTGNTEDYSGLTIDCDNNGYSIINGIVRGERGACKVESIGAGGYNIQCWHIRVLVHAI